MYKLITGITSNYFKFLDCDQETHPPPPRIRRTEPCIIKTETSPLLPGGGPLQPRLSERPGDEEGGEVFAVVDKIKLISSEVEVDS